MKALRFLDENIEKMLCVIALALMSAVIVAAGLLPVCSEQLPFLV